MRGRLVDFLASVRFKLVLLVAAPMAVVLAVVTIQAERFAEASEAHEREELRGLLYLIRAAQQERIDQAKEFLGALRHMAPALGPGRDPEGCYRNLAELRRHYPDFDDFGFVDQDGIVICSARPPVPGQGMGDRPHIRRALDGRGFAVGRFQLGRASGQPQIPFAHFLPGGAGVPEGAAYLGASVRWFDRLLRKAPMEDVAATIVDEDNRILYHYPDDDSMGGILPATEDFRRLLSAEGYAEQEAAGTDGTLQLHVLGRIDFEGSPLFLRLSVPREHVLIQATEIRFDLLADVAVIAFVVILLAWWGARAVLLDKVSRLAGAAMRLGGGDLAARTGIAPGRGELCRLAVTFDEMAASLQHAQGSLRESEARFRNVVEAAPDAIFLVDPEGVIRLANTEAERLFAYTREELEGLPVEMLVPEHLRKDHAARRAHYADDARARPLGLGAPLQVRRKDGSIFPAQISLSPLAAAQGAGVIAVVRDVSVEVRHKEEVAAFAESLKQANRELAALAYTLAHDLRAPLRAIHGFTYGLAEEHGDRLAGDAGLALARVMAAATRMDGMIDGVLDYLHATGSELRRTPEDAAAVARSVAERLRRQHPRTELVIGALPPASADQMMLKRLLSVLLDNAFKFSALAAAPLVEIGVAEADGEPAYFVRDNGVGFDMRYAGKLFGAFQRMYHARHEFSGIGIGLATAKRIVELHGGRIWAEAAPERGAVFYFTLAD